jgi:hypothetical protein
MLGPLAEGGYGGWMVVDTVDLPERERQAASALAFLGR